MLVLRPGALGDTLLAVPALRALRRRVPEEWLTLAAHGGAARLLASAGEVDEGMEFDNPRLAWLFRPGSEGTCERVVAWLDPAAVPGLRNALVVAPSRPPSPDVHCSLHLLRSVGGAEPDTRALRLEPQRSNEILIHPGSGAVTKNWPAHRFAAVIRALLEQRAVRLIVGDADAAAAAAVDQHLGRPLERLEGLQLADLARRLAGCRAYLGNDSGVSHLAGLCGAPTVALFGPTSPVVWRPLGPRVHVLPFDARPEHVANLLLQAT